MLTMSLKSKEQKIYLVWWFQDFSFSNNKGKNRNELFHRIFGPTLTVVANMTAFRVLILPLNQSFKMSSGNYWFW